jgi:GNAT superfamily N-acetyltransferase
MTMLRIEVLPADALDDQTRAEVIGLCEAAYGEDMSRMFELFPGSTHVLGRELEGMLVCHAEWVTRWLQPEGQAPLRTAYVESVAMAPARQGLGYGTAVMRRVAELVAADPTWELAALSPAVPDWYASLGWEAWRGPLAIRRDAGLEASPPHESVMILRLPRTPTSLDPTTLLTAEWREGEAW